MAKITAKEVTDGMVFTIEEVDSLGFCWRKGEDVLGSAYSPPLKTELIVTKACYKYGRNQLIDFKIKGGTQEYTTYWNTFKHHTKYQSGVIAAPKSGVSVTSKGPYAGFDLGLKATEVHELSVFTYITVELEFIGTFVGAKKLSTKMINEIKTSVGFADKCKKILTEHLKTKEVEIKGYIAKVDALKLENSWQREVGAPVHVNYKAGKIEFQIILTEDFDTVLKHIEQQVDYFIKAKTTNVRFFKEK